MATGDIQDQVGLIGNKLGSFTENQGVDIAPPSSVFETTDWFGPTKTLARGLGEANAMYGTVDEYGRSTSPPEEYVDPKVLNEKYSLPNHPAFDKAMPDSVAKSIYDHRVEEDQRADAVARRPEGFWHGAAQYGTQFVADALDPLNLAAMFVPGVGEAKFVAEGAGTLARIGGRAAAGAINADIGQIPLIAMKYGQSRFEQDDYNAYNAMLDLATGAGMGALFHAGIGAFTDRLQSHVANSEMQKALEGDAGLRESTLKTALAQLAGDNDVEVRPVFDAAGLKSATDTRNALLEEAAAVSPIAPGSRAAARIAEIDEELSGGSRLAAINAELGKAIDPARRAQLEAERALVEANPVPLERVGALMKERGEIVALEEARSVAQQSGLMHAAEKSEVEITAHLQAKHAEDYEKLMADAKAAGMTVQEAHATAADGMSLEELERAYQQTRAAQAALRGERTGQRPNGTPAGEGAGAANAGQVNGAAQPGAAGTAGGEAGGAGSAGGAAGAAAAASPSANRSPRFLDSKWLKRAGEVGEGRYDMGKGGAAITAQVRMALQRGDKVEYVVDGGARTVEITGIGPTQMPMDAQGRQWGSLSLATDNTGKEGIRITPRDAALQADNAQQEALRAADGKPTATQQKVTDAAAMAGKKPVEVDKLVQAAADQIQDHMAFLQNAEAMGVLNDADRLAIQQLGALDEESNGLRKAAGQAAMCIARGLG